MWFLKLKVKGIRKMKILLAVFIFSACLVMLSIATFVVLRVFVEVKNEIETIIIENQIRKNKNNRNKSAELNKSLY